MPPRRRRFRQRRRTNTRWNSTSNTFGNSDSWMLEHERTRVVDENAHAKNCMVVFHLPKCGGSSLLYAMRYFALERGWEFLDYNTRDQFGGQVHRAIHFGHFYKPFLERFNTSQCLQMTLLRDPIDRVISHFYYWEYKENDWPRVATIGQECQNRPYLPRSFNQFSNLMSRMLGGTHGDLWNIFQPESVQCQHAYPLPSPKDDSPLSKRAREQLENMDLVCFLDDFEGCLKRVRQLLGLPQTVLVAPHKNSATGAKQMHTMDTSRGKAPFLSPHDLAMQNATIRDLIGAVNQADVALYEWAVHKFKTSG